MKNLTLIACLGLMVAVGPGLVREIHHRFIAVSRSGVPLDEIYRCPSCRGWSVVSNEGPDRRCTGCGHRWSPEAAAATVWLGD